MNTWQIVLTEYAWLGAWWSLSLLIGTAALGLLGSWTRPIRAPNLELLLFFGFAAGVAVQILVLILLALCGLLQAPATLFVFGVLAVLALRVHRLAWPGGWLADLHGLLRAPSLLAALPVLLVVAGFAIKPLGPAYAHDEISYHLPYARFYLEQGGLAVQEYLRFPLHAHHFNLLYTMALMRDSATMAHGMHASAGFAVLLGLHGMARHWFGPWTALFAVLLLSLVGTLQLGFGNAYVDLGLMLYATGAMFALAFWQSGRERAWLLLAGALFGCAIGTKYYGLILAAPLGLWVLWVGRRPADLFRFALAAGLFGLFWYLRSWLISGNPVHPFLGDWFGLTIWRPGDLLSQHFELAEHGIARSFGNFLTLPLHVAFEPGSFHGRIAGDAWLLGLFYLALFALRRQPRALQVLAGIAFAWLVFWFYTAQVMRYLLPVAPVMALTAAGLFARAATVLDRAARARWPLADWRGRLPAWLRLSGVALLIAVPRLYADLKQVAIEPGQQRAYLQASKEGHELFLQAADDPRIGTGPLLQLGLAGSYYYFPGTLYGDWTGHYAYTSFMHLTRERGWILWAPEDLRAMLLERGIRGVVFSKEHMGMFHPDEPEPWARCFETVFENRYGTVMIPRVPAADCGAEAAADGDTSADVR